MVRSRSLVASWNPARCEPILALLRERQLWPVLVRDSGEIASAVEQTDVALIVLNGPCEFCRPFFQMLGQARSTLDVPPLVVIACDSSEAFAVASLRAGANDYLTEPLDISSWDRTIAQVVPEAHPAASVSDVPLTGGDVLVGASPAMQALRMHIRRVAATECNVLITGETGTGKELVAQLVHQNSKRSNHPLICINCAAIPDSLLESELFGYERGAFTGATTTSQGKLMTANKGTVFFDEIGDMSPTAQAKILRAIEAKEVQRLGATRKYETDVRILAATHHNLDELANVDAFRRDLYFRLNVGRIHLPSLRERKSDIAGLAERMVLELNQKLGRQVEAPDGKAIRILTDHNWPGNVRELKNVMERIFINRESGRINQEDLAAVLQAGGYGANPPQADDAQTLRDALQTCNGNKSKAAERLNCSRMTVYRKIAKYGMDERADQETIGAFHKKPA